MCSVTVKTFVCPHLFRFQKEIENLSCELKNYKTFEKISVTLMRFCYYGIRSEREIL
jgi:hypothetical protein